MRPSICLEMVYEDEPFTQRIDRIADMGFEAVEIWTWTDKDLNAIEDRLDHHDLKVTNLAGITEQSRPEDLERALTNPNARAAALKDIEASLKVAERLGCPFVTVHLGPRRDVPYDQMYESVVKGLREATTAAAETEVTLLLEPLNWSVDHAGYFLEQSETAYEIVEEVDSPALGVLFDIYHQQITEGNIIANLCQNQKYIDYVHVADVPGRHEPGTGELNYPNIFETLREEGYGEYIGFEFTPETGSEMALETIAQLSI